MQKYRNQIIAGLGIALIVYILLVLFVDNSGQFDQNVLSQIQEFPLYLVPLLILTQIGAGVFRFMEWHYYLGVIGAQDKISIKDSLIIFVTGFMFAVSPGKIAEVLKVVLLKIKTDVPIAVSAPIVVAERVVDGLAVIITLLIALIVARDQIELGEYRAFIEGVIITSTIILSVGLVAVQIKSLAYFFLGLIQRLPLLRRAHQPLLDFYESSHNIFQIRHLIPTVLMGMGVYMSSTTGFLIVLSGYGLDITWQLFLETTFIVGVVSAIGALSFLPNGAGITEVSALAIMNVLIVPSNPSLATAVAAVALIQSFFHKWFRVLVGMGVGIYYRNHLFTSELEQELEQIDTKPEGVKTGVSVDVAG